MRPVSDALRAALTAGRQRRITRVTVLDDSYAELALLSGEVGYAIGGTVELSDDRRKLTLRIANPDGALTPADQYSLIYWNRQIRVERGLLLPGGTPEYVDLGIFLVDEPTVDVRASGTSLTIRGQDRLKRADKSKFTAPTTYALATRVGVVLADLADDAGMGGTRYSLDDGGATLAAARTWELGEERLKAMYDLARDYSLRLYVDALGGLRSEPIVDPEQRPIVWEFRRGADATMLGVSKGWSDDRLYNHVLVTSESADSTPVYAEASDLNPASPAYVNGPMGDRLYQYTSAMITSTGQAQAVADALLPKVALIEETIELPAIVNPALEYGDRVLVVEEDSRTETSYALESVSIPLGAGAMRLRASALRAFV